MNFAENMQTKDISQPASATNAAGFAKNDAPVYRNVDISQLVDEVKNLIVKKEKADITLKLSPEHLGKVKLVINIENSLVHTRLEVENESVRQVVQNNLDTLKQSLQQNGIQLSSFSISLSNQEQKPQGRFEPKKKLNNSGKEIRIEEEIKPENKKKMGYNTYEYLA